MIRSMDDVLALENANLKASIDGPACTRCQVASAKRGSFCDDCYFDSLSGLLDGTPTELPFTWRLT